ncbi:MAG: T9SS type A sorting domain-containing protein [Bacteroidaceae bacterium]|nr:T9SS type A sorting domain-containing protein [Bacteroidaceae bacterium]
MKNKSYSSFFRLLPLLTIILLGANEIAAQQVVSGVYVGGHIRRNRPSTISTLRNSGFTYVILFNVHVESDGTLTTDGETIVKNGEYVFTKTQPYYQQDVANLKTAPTSIQRVEICIGGWGNTSYENIKKLVNSSGTASNSILYKNFKALKDALPEIDAVNNDDEHCYDAETASKFHIMMHRLGYKTTLAPYTNKSFWTSLCSKIHASRPWAVDRVMVQCYDGGAYNNPSDWNFSECKTRHAGRTNYQTEMNKSIAQMETWYKNKAAIGGFVWVYNDETWNLNQWASAMNRTFQCMTVAQEDVVINCYSEYNYGGYCVGLPAGEFTQADLALYGIAANDISSVELAKEGYKIRMFRSVNCTGTSYSCMRSIARMTTSYNNAIRSITIIPDEETGIRDIAAPEPSLYPKEGAINIQHARGELISIFNAAGHMVYSAKAEQNDETISLQSLPSGIYIIHAGNKTAKVKR